MKLLPWMFAACLMLAAVPPLTAEKPGDASHLPVAGVPEIVGYFPQDGIYNRRYLPIDLVKSGAIRALTQIDYAQGNIRDNACVIADPQADINFRFKAEDSIDGVADAPDAPLKGDFHQLQLLRKRYPKVRLLISLEGHRADFEEAAKPENRVSFVHSCVERFLEGHVAPGLEIGNVFEGIDVDWEYPDTDHAGDYLALLAEFRRQMDALQPGLTLSIASGAARKHIDPIDWKRVAQSVDQIGVMAYDFQGPWSHNTGFVAPLLSDDPNRETVATIMETYLAAGVPSRKLLLGLPFYAYEWHNVPDNGNHGLHSQGDPVRGDLNQSSVTSLLDESPNAKLYRDPVSHAPWIYDGDHFMTFEDTASLKVKAQYARDHHLGGMMIWELSSDTNDAQLLRALEPPSTVTEQPGSGPVR